MVQSYGKDMMLKVIVPAAVAASLFAATGALADEATTPSSLQVIGPAVSREMTVRTTEQISAAVAEATRPAPTEPAGERGGDSSR
jgi:hypothetical protein